MPTYKLTYFDIRGLAEGIRYILKQANVDFVDNRLKHDLVDGKWNDNPEWTTVLKPRTPFGKMPILEVDGKKMLAESCAIARYLARAHNLTGNDEWDAARCDMIVDWAVDMRTKMRPVYVAKLGGDMEKANSELAEVKKESLPAFLSQYEKLLTENGSSGWFVGKNVTWADLFVAEIMRVFENVDATMFNEHASVKAHVERVHALPNIKKWVETRKQTII